MDEPRPIPVEVAPDPSLDARDRILSAATALIASGGRDAATTRAVAAAAQVQAPTIYRLFGDKRGLLAAVAQAGLVAYMAGKAAQAPQLDPVADLRDGWDAHVAFGLANPGLFAILNGEAQAQGPSPAVAAGLDVLRGRIRRIALAGRLRVTEERALALLRSAYAGTVLTLLGQPGNMRDAGLAEAAREAVVAAITSDAGRLADAGLAAAAVSLRASLDRAPALTDGERHLLGELLDRIANSH